MRKFLTTLWVALLYLSPPDRLDLLNQLSKYWFSDAGKKAWFHSTPEIDQYLNAIYLPLWRWSIQNITSVMGSNKDEIFISIIVLDQLPLNILRDNPATYQSSHLALMLAKLLLATPFFDSASDDKKLFTLLPFLHSEVPGDINIALELSKKWKLNKQYEVALNYLNTTRRYGRFPHRNQLLGRVSSNDEVSFLKS